MDSKKGYVLLALLFLFVTLLWVIIGINLDTNKSHAGKSIFRNAVIKMKAANLQETLEFYKTKFGFEIKEQFSDNSGGQYFIAGRDSINVIFCKADSLLSSDKSISPVFCISNVDSFYSGLKKDIKNVGELITLPDGKKEFSCIDLNGNEIFFLETY